MQFKQMYFYCLVLILSDECVSTKLGVTENFVSSLYLLIQSSTLKKCIEHCLTALAALLHVHIYVYIYIYIFFFFPIFRSSSYCWIFHRRVSPGRCHFAGPKQWTCNVSGSGRRKQASQNETSGQSRLQLQHQIQTVLRHVLAVCGPSKRKCVQGDGYSAGREFPFRGKLS